ncbi:hypothetical protein MOE86_20075 [Bacillus atrophaeus]|uniref:phage tail assembly chaperone G n=1 Tax=Bacillus atrophaeus TaxID=1452 RepID=UPI002280F7EC|nr:hypothetical protein [Bacillus atrophaeus]MCY9198929.1 hypothetical protein [Bacillus atrophaeus]
MQLTLRINGEDKTFSTPFIKGRMLREAIKLSKNTNFDDLSEESLDSLVNYVVRVYDNQFDLDTFYDGIASDELISTISDTIQGVVGTAVVEKAQQEGLQESADVEADLTKN